MPPCEKGEHEDRVSKDITHARVRSFDFVCHIAAIYLVEQNFGRNVFGRSAQRPRAVLDVFGEAEIRDAHVAIAERRASVRVRASQGGTQ